MTDEEIAKNPELFHYTDWKGLEGIRGSDTLWATRFDSLNDKAEITQLEGKLLPALVKRISVKISERAAHDSAFSNFMKAVGGNEALSTIYAQETIDSGYGVSIKGKPGYQPMFQPYIVSFCAHSEDPKYVSQNGLLSQWRGYGRGTNGLPVDGYAIVFDTRKLLELVAEEYSTFLHYQCHLWAVIYDDDRLDLEAQFPEMLHFLTEVSTARVFHYDPKIANDTVRHFLEAVTRVKHGGFFEEREIRIVAIPATENSRARTRGGNEMPLTDLKTFERRGKDIDYIALFDRATKSLPITRIIVGPSRDQEEAWAKARFLFPRISVEKSDIPLKIALE